MKRKVMILGAIVVVLVIGMVLVGTALAQGPVGDEDGVRAPVGGAYGPAHGFVDVDGDGINDCYLTGDCGAAGVVADKVNAYRFAQGSQGQTSRNGDVLQNRQQQQDCTGDCTQNGTGDRIQTRLQQQDCNGDCAQDVTGDEIQTRSRDGSATGQGSMAAGASTGSGQRSQRAH